MDVRPFFEPLSILCTCSSAFSVSHQSGTIWPGNFTTHKTLLGSDSGTLSLVTIRISARGENAWQGIAVRPGLIGDFSLTPTE